MIPAHTIASLRNAPSVENISSVMPRIVGVGGASATVRGYIDVPVVIAGKRVKHPLIVVEELAYSLLIGIYILGPHEAQLRVGASSSIRLSVKLCTVCDEMRADSPRLMCPNEAAYVSKEVTLASCAASRVLCASHHRSSSRLSSSQSQSSCRLLAHPAPPSPLST